MLIYSLVKTINIFLKYKFICILFPTFNLNNPRPSRDNIPKKEMCSYSQYTVNGIKRTLSCWERKLGITDFSLIKYEQEFGHDKTRDYLKELVNKK